MITGYCVRGCHTPQGTPEPTTKGSLICQKCLARIGWLLDDAAELAQITRAAVTPSMAPQQTERVSGSRAPAPPLNLQALEACDTIYSAIARWITYWAQRLQIKPPKTLLNATLQDHEITGVKDLATPEQVRERTTSWGAWLKHYMPIISKHPAVEEMLLELEETVRKISRQYPRGSGRQLIQQKPRFCPICGLRKVRVTWKNEQPEVVCQQCKWQFQADWGELLAAIGIGAGSTQGGSDNSHGNHLETGGDDGDTRAWAGVGGGGHVVGVEAVEGA